MKWEDQLDEKGLTPDGQEFWQLAKFIGAILAVCLAGAGFYHLIY